MKDLLLRRVIATLWEDYNERPINEEKENLPPSSDDYLFYEFITDEDLTC